MEQSGEYRISAPRDQVWAALNDPDILARCIDGCQSMEKVEADRFLTSVKAKIGPVSALFKGELNLTDIVPPESYSIHANVKGGPAGFGKGTARVLLTDDGDATRLSYQVDASVGGKLAQIGSRLIDGAARKMADDFFAAFGTIVGKAPPEQMQAGADEVAVQAGFEPSGQWKIWLVVFLILGMALLFAF